MCGHDRPSSRQVVNDLRAQAKRLERTGSEHLVRSLTRGANEIETLLDELRKSQLTERLERHR